MNIILLLVFIYFFRFKAFYIYIFLYFYSLKGISKMRQNKEKGHFRAFSFFF